MQVACVHQASPKSRLDIVFHLERGTALIITSGLFNVRVRQSGQ